MRLAPALLLAACGGSAPATTRPSVPLDLVVVPPDGVTLETATLQLDAFVLDTCDGTLVVPVDTALDGLAPSDAPAHVLPGGWCGLQAVLPPDAADLLLTGAEGGEPFSVAIDLGGIVVLGPFFADERPLLLVVALEALRGTDQPVLAELWVDVDADGVLGEADVLLR